MKNKTQIIDYFLDSPRGWDEKYRRVMITKPENYKKPFYTIKDKMNGIINILFNKAFAVHFAEDE